MLVLMTLLLSSLNFLNMILFAFLNTLKNYGKHVFISGPIPTLGRGIGRFTRILHTWLQSVCSSYNMCSIDNFTLFWERLSFFRKDGIHPTMLGTRKLSGNIFHSVHLATDVTNYSPHFISYSSC